MKHNLKRATATVGVLAFVAGGLMVAAAGSASAGLVGTPQTVTTHPGGLILKKNGTAFTGNAVGTDTIDWATAAACPATANAVVLDYTSVSSGVLQASQSFSDDTLGGPVDIQTAGQVDSGLAGRGSFQMSDLASNAGLANGNTYQFIIDCLSGQTTVESVADGYITISNASTGAFSYSTTPPTTAPVPGITVAVSPTSIQLGAGASSTITATVASGDTGAQGTIRFLELESGTWTPIGAAEIPLTGAATYTQTVSADPSVAGSLAQGTYQFAVRYTAAGGSTAYSSGDTTTTTGGVATLGVTGTGQLTIQGDVDLEQGHFTYTLPTTKVEIPLHKTDPASHNAFTGTAPMGAVAVDDDRYQTYTGWSFSACATTFTKSGGTLTVPNALGWTPADPVQAHTGVVKGAVVAPGYNDTDSTATGGIGLQQPTAPATCSNTLASVPTHTEGTSDGQDHTVLNAALKISMPYSTPVGNYTSTLTFTVTPVYGS